MNDKPKTSGRAWRRQSMLEEQRTKRAQEAPPSQSDSTCQHHWKIEPPAGSISVGTCLHCAEQREFRNSEDFGDYRALTTGKKKPELYVTPTARNKYP